MTPELASPSPNYHTTPTGGHLSSRQISVYRCSTRRVFSGTGLELVTKPDTIRYLYNSATVAGGNGEHWHSYPLSKSPLAARFMMMSIMCSLVTCRSHHARGLPIIM
ncbi:hypothetical protein TNCV_2640171 [Trichonephila clavipes]|nr:hypothetical protein TNCV_2640171 [Trichonephila clavipes]